MIKKPSISVIITVFNSGDVLEPCLKSLKSQTKQNFEIIVVDESSKDNTKEIAEKYADQFLNEGQERCQQRNAGAKIAKADYLLFLDPDMELSPRLIEELSKFLETNTAILIPEVSFGKGFWAKCKQFERLMYRKGDIAQLPRVYPKKIFLDVGGFDDTMLGTEDLDLFYRIKQENKDLKISEVKSVIYHNEGRLTYSQIVKRMTFYTKSLRKYKKRYPHMLKKQLSLFRYLRKYNHFLAHPLLTLGFIVMKGSETIVVLYSIKKYN
ncbi:hypothetical protein CMI46_01290 [Candidatus Pacearchaeota archaeon]|nr:hypothetical protein [Candidatus Pacearchaeota archaeon]|tara:strand:+ start:17755 stop:18555 length:801 start_codon:yes stop_codon:yes gene_type:complete